MPKHKTKHNNRSDKIKPVPATHLFGAGARYDYGLIFPVHKGVRKRNAWTKKRSRRRNSLKGTLRYQIANHLTAK